MVEDERSLLLRAVEAIGSGVMLVNPFKQRTEVTAIQFWKLAQKLEIKPN